MRIKSLITGILLSLMLLNIAFADSSANFNVDVSALNNGGGFAAGPNFAVNDVLVGFVDGNNAQAPNFNLQGGLVALETFCGNANLELGEVCDEGANNTQYCPYGDQVQCAGCNNECSGVPQITYCGDNMVDSTHGENCDDGNTANLDGCDAQCHLECGNGTVESTEECDDGNLNDGDGCSSLCLKEKSGGGGLPGPTGSICGNNILEGYEQCDDGNNVTEDCPYGSSSCTVCSSNCNEVSKSGTYCGDSILQSDYEECDDGNQIATDACTTDCQLAACGDGFVQSGVEQCDDGNTNQEDACLTSCTPNQCGDGFLYRGVEQCDDGNQTDGDGCNAICELETVCGDGTKEGYEECDDGNQNNGDGCSDICQIEPECGNSVIEAGEDCDDGNLTPGDGCSATCRLEIDRLITVIAKPEKRVPSTGNWSNPGTLRFYDSSSKSLALTIPINTNSNGYAEFESTKVPVGLYDVSLKGQSHLTHIIRDIVIDESETIVLDFTGGGSFFLLAGDVHSSKDDYVNGMDFSAMSSVIYQSSLDSDLNLDGQVNGLDFSIAAVNIYKSGERI